MEVILAGYAGACYGVQRALDMAQSAIEDGSPAVTLGPIIHNPKVVKGLEDQGIRAVSSIDDVADQTVIIRSHGVTPQEKQQVVARNLSIIDATCPHVARAQKAAAKLASAGCSVIVVGEKGHPEVEALVAYAQMAGADTFVVGGMDDIPGKLTEPVGVVVQTTQRKGVLDGILEVLKQRGIKPDVKNTICFATTQRQDSAAELASRVDAMVVLGGKNSSNTTRLYEICASICPRSYHVETADDCDAQWFAGCGKIGVTAGASTPESQIQELLAYLEAL